MSDVWKEMFKYWIECYEALRTLRINDVLDDEDWDGATNRMLYEIIETFKSEVEE